MYTFKTSFAFISIFLFLHLGSFGQMYHMLDSVKSLSISQLLDSKNTLSKILKSPLGPMAQLLRNSTYKSSIDSTSSGLWIKYNDQFFKYKNGNLYQPNECNENLMVRKGLDRKLKKARRSLTSLERRSNYAYNIIRTLQHSRNRFVISIVESIDSYTLFPISDDRVGVLNNNAYAFQVLESGNRLVDYAPFDKIGSGAEIRWKLKQGLIGLAHELAHAYDANFGLVDDRLILINGMTMCIREIRALFHENMIRKDLNKSFRFESGAGQGLIANGVPYTYPLPVLATY